MADQNPNSSIDPYKLIKVVLNPDGSLTRSTQVPNIPPSSTHCDINEPQSESVHTQDIPLNPSKKTWMRVFQPPKSNLSPNQKLPLILYFHGGGFVLYSPSSLPFHESCVQMATHLPAIVLSVDYQLAPEHKLPSAYDDAMEALLWVRSQALMRSDEYKYKFCEFVDFSKCFIMGSSSGGNITYQLGLRAVIDVVEPVKIIGLIMNQPFFGGVERSGSELRMVNDRIIPLVVSDLMWELCLPLGADRDHEYCNPIGSHDSHLKQLPKCFVRGYGGDPLVDRQKEFVKMLEAHGVCVVKHFIEDGFHACELFVPHMAQALLVDIKDFIHGCCSDANSNL